jgi:hypothetical protein
VPDLPIELEGGLAARLARVADVEGKIPRALETLGPMGGREVLIVGGAHEIRARQLADLGARVLPATEPSLPGSADVLVSFWSAFRGVDPEEVAAAERVLRPGGRILVVHDYGRDDVSRLRGVDLPEYGTWGRRDGPFLLGGFRIRVLHCWWTFEDLDTMRDFLSEAFGPDGAALADAQKRARLSWNVAIYHRTKGDASAGSAPAAIVSR